VVGRFEVPQGCGIALELSVEQRVFEAHGVVTSPALEMGPLVEEQGLADADAVAGDFFAFDIQTSVDALQKKMHRTLLPLRAAAPLRVVGGWRRRTEPCGCVRSPAQLRRVRGRFYRHAAWPPPCAISVWPTATDVDVDVFIAADAAADTMTKRHIAAPGESLTGAVRTYRRLEVARSARASEGALVTTKRSLCVHTEVPFFC
jgi:hypothetical protein